MTNDGLQPPDNTILIGKLREFASQWWDDPRLGRSMATWMLDNDVQLLMPVKRKDRQASSDDWLTDDDGALPDGFLDIGGNEQIMLTYTTQQATLRHTKEPCWCAIYSLKDVLRICENHRITMLLIHSHGLHMGMLHAEGEWNAFDPEGVVKEDAAQRKEKKAGRWKR